MHAISSAHIEAMRAISAAGPEGFENRDRAGAGRYLFPRQRIQVLLKHGLVAEVRDTPNSIARYVLTNDGMTLLDLPLP